ncbi:hypothetical protein Fmac_032997 [Flemingia macrophylla]|uniref:Uncharacterized protein n=1 Tax=Flemingia macrophylla TaxID=520843 RepID=A0ABD1L6I7_9FABA
MHLGGWSWQATAFLPRAAGYPKLVCLVFMWRFQDRIKRFMIETNFSRSKSRFNMFLTRFSQIFQKFQNLPSHGSQRFSTPFSCPNQKFSYIIKTFVSFFMIQPDFSDFCRLFRLSTTTCPAFFPRGFQPRFHVVVFCPAPFLFNRNSFNPARNSFNPAPAMFSLVVASVFMAWADQRFRVSQPPTFFMVLTPFSRFLARFQPKLFQPRPGHVFTRCCLGFHGMGGSTFSCEPTTNVFHGFNPVFTFSCPLSTETLSTPPRPCFHSLLPRFSWHGRINVFV